MADSPLLVRFEKLGRQTTNVTRWSINSSYLVSTDGWEVELFDTDRANLRGLELQPVELSVNGASQVLGRVDQTDVGGNGRAVTLRGRDYLSDIVECNVDPTLKLKAGMFVFDALLLACGPCGIDLIVDEADVVLRNIRTGRDIGKKGRDSKKKGFREAKLEDYKPEPGQGIYEFCNKIVSRQGATIQPGVTRKMLVLTEPNYATDPPYSITRTDDPENAALNTIVSASASRDYSSFPSFVLFTGNSGRAGKSSKGESQTLDMDLLTDALNIPELNRVIRPNIHHGRLKPGAGNPTGLYRLLYFRDQEARNKDQLAHSTRRALAERLKPTLEYRCQLEGHVDPVSGAVYSVDTIIKVQDDICDVNEPMWIAERTLAYSPENGATTDLVCWRLGAFQI